MVAKKTTKKTAAKKTTKKSAKKKVAPAILDAVDVAFVLDVTGSMGPYIDEAKAMVVEITKGIQENNDLDIRVALVVYRDHPPQDFTFVAKAHDFVTVDDFNALLAQYNAGGGGDIPEAVYDGLNAALGLSWRPGADRAVYLIGDAPPHKQCLCGLTPEGLIAKLKELKIEVNAHSIANMTTTTEAFKEFVDATGGKLSVGNRPADTSELYTDSLMRKSSDITTSRVFYAGLSTLGYTPDSATKLTEAEVETVATTAGLSVDAVNSTINYIKKRGL